MACPCRAVAYGSAKNGKATIQSVCRIGDGMDGIIVHGAYSRSGGVDQHNTCAIPGSARVETGYQEAAVRPFQQAVDAHHPVRRISADPSLGLGNGVGKQSEAKSSSVESFVHEVKFGAEAKRRRGRQYRAMRLNQP